MAEQTLEDLLVEACENLGKKITTLPEEERAIVVELRNNVEKFAADMAEKNVYIDKTAFLAGAIIVHNGINTEEVVQAAVEVINRDYEYRKGTPD